MNGNFATYKESCMLVLYMNIVIQTNTHTPKIETNDPLIVIKENIDLLRRYQKPTHIKTICEKIKSVLLENKTTQRSTPFIDSLG
jgi:hypothetical protein